MDETKRSVAKLHELHSSVCFRRVDAKHHDLLERDCAPLGGELVPRPRTPYPGNLRELDKLSLELKNKTKLGIAPGELHAALQALGGE